MKFYVHGWRMMSWYGFDLEYKKASVIKVDMRCTCMINIIWLFEYIWYVVST